MKLLFSAAVLAALANLPQTIQSLSLHTSIAHRSTAFCEAGSCSSTFTAVSENGRKLPHRRTTLSFAKSDMLMYEPSSDLPNKISSSNEKPNNIMGGSGMWNVLASTERWISDTLSSSIRAAAPGLPAGNNPYARKEVSYVCETGEDLALIVAGIFRRVREGRELGESHGRTEEAVAMDRGPDYRPGTMRQTQVVVIPWNKDIESFSLFDSLVNAINKARRNARDLVTDLSLEKLQARSNKGTDIGERDWVVSINVAHLHPRYGEKTNCEALEEMKNEATDLNAKHKDMRTKARQSPYPTLMLEVKAMPPPDHYENNASPSIASESRTAENNEEKNVYKDDIQKLEFLFGMSATMKHSTKEAKNDNDDDFYNSIGKAFGIKEVLALSPLEMGKKWITENDSMFNLDLSTFSLCSAKHVDAAYEFVFSALAMQTHKLGTSFKTGEPSSDETNATTFQQMKIGSRSYIIMPSFVSSSATSFEKFATEITNIIASIPGLSDLVSVTTMHPEDVNVSSRSPIPTLVLNRTDVGNKL